MIRWNIDLVKEFVKNNSKCELLSIKYESNDKLLKFKCLCGEEFDATFAKFKDRNKRQCNDCGRINQKDLAKLDYNYVKNFVNDNSNCILLSSEYINNSEKLSFICECGEDFKMSFAKFKDSNRRQCYSCGIKIRIDGSKSNYEDVKLFIESKNCKLISKEYNRAKDRLKIQCFCGEVFSTSFDVFQRELSGKQRCNICTNKISVYEKIVKDILNDCNITYIMEYTFDDCKYKKKLRFDFAVFDKFNLKFLIEVDGAQHFRPLKNYGGKKAFEEGKKRDEIKNKYCKDNGIMLIRLPFYKYKEFDMIIKQYIK